jgi:1-acyl-sn-glycerol-3-phosphate acyltransferase
MARLISKISSMSEAVFTKSTFYSFSRFWWSIYFVLGIAVIGGIFGYIVTMSLFILSFLLTPIERLSTPVRHLAESIQCVCIRFLLKIQPWLKCKTNFPEIIGFYDHFKTRRILFVANHRSNLDTFLLISYIPGLRGLAKKSLFYNVFLGAFMVVAGFIPVEKGSSESFVTGLAALRDRLLKRDRPVLIFPENTRCDKGFASLRKFGAAIFNIAIESDALIVPIVIRNTDHLMGRGDFFLNPHEPVSLEMLEGIKARDFTDPQELRDVIWKKIELNLSAGRIA